PRSRNTARGRGTITSAITASCFAMIFRRGSTRFRSASSISRIRPGSAWPNGHWIFGSPDESIREIEELRNGGRKRIACGGALFVLLSSSFQPDGQARKPDLRGFVGAL